MIDWTAASLVDLVAKAFRGARRAKDLLPERAVRLLLVGLAGQFAFAGCALGPPTPGSFAPTGSMSEARSGAAIAVLDDGTVLICGGGTASGSGATASAELYDPATGMFSVAGSMTVGRIGATATTLLDGRVLVTGGRSGDGILSSAEIYDPKTRRFSASAPTMDALIDHVATRLDDGRVLVTSEWPEETLVGLAEIYDPATKTSWSTGAAVPWQATATLLDDGRVLLAGGREAGVTGEATAHSQVFIPTTGRFEPVGDLNYPRAGAAAARLKDGRVLIVGGYYGVDGLDVPKTAEIFDPKTGSFTETGELPEVHGNLTATTLANGKVLVAGGTIGGDAVDPYAAFLFDPATGSFTRTGALSVWRDYAAVALLKNGRVLFAGGTDESGPEALSSAELYWP